MTRYIPPALRPAGRTAIALLMLASLVLFGQRGAHASTHANASLPTLNYPLLVSSGFFSSLDPAQAGETQSDLAITTMNASLVRRLPNGKYIPYLATWTVSKNHKVYTFSLRHDARFSNGDHLTAQDVVYSIRRLLAPTTAAPGASSSTILGAVDYNAGKTTALPGVKAMNTYTVRIETSQPSPSFISGFGQAGSGIVLDHKAMNGKTAAAKGNYLTSTCSGNVGAGPFKPVCLNKSSDPTSFYASGTTPTLTLVPNPYYFGKHPKYRLVIRNWKDTQTTYLAFQSGQLDATQVPSTNVSQEQGKKGFLHFPTYLIWYVSPAFDVAPFDNIHCRLAVAYGIDTATIDKTVLHGTWSPIHTMEPKGVVGYYAGKDNPSYNPAKAQSELAQCPGGIHNQKLVYVGLSSDFEDVFGGAIPAQLSTLGIDIKGASTPSPTWLKDAFSPQKSTDTPILQSGLTFNDPAGWCLLRKTGYVLNSSDFTNPQYDALCAKAAKSFVTKKAAKLYQQAAHIAMSQGVYIPIGQVQAFGDVKTSKVSGIVGDPLWVQLVPKDYDWANITVK